MNSLGPNKRSLPFLLLKVTQKESTTRKGKCISRVAFYENGNNGYEGGETLLALRHPIQDMAYFSNGTPAEGVEIPGHADFTDMVIGLQFGGTLEAAFLLDGGISEANPEYLQYLNFNLGLIDEEMGYPGPGPFAGISTLLALDAIGPGAAFEGSLSRWDPEPLKPRCGAAIGSGLAPSR